MHFLALLCVRVLSLLCCDLYFFFLVGGWELIKAKGDSGCPMAKCRVQMSIAQINEYRSREKKTGPLKPAPDKYMLSLLESKK
jgi:hypothetical protein